MILNPRAYTRHIDVPALDRRVEINVHADPWGRAQAIRLELVHRYPGRTWRVFMVCSTIGWLALILSSWVGK